MTTIVFLQGELYTAVSWNGKYDHGVVHALGCATATHGTGQYTGDLEFIFSGYHLDRTVPDTPEPVYCLMPSLATTSFV